MSQFPAAVVAPAPRALKALRTMKLDTAGSRFIEGPVEARGYDHASVFIREKTSTALATGTLEVKGSIDGMSLASFSTPGTMSNSARTILRLGDSTVGIGGVPFIDGETVTAQAGVELVVTIELARSETGGRGVRGEGGGGGES